ncbi:MAG: hypothetical protein M0P39_14085 [Rhodocyclaceae bacterium]|nr:hypothetical protein [Rhodocyclaceae bacterium]
MQLRTEIQIATMIKAMKDVVIPAVDGKNDLALQQAQLVIGLLNLMAQQLPMQFRFDRDELQRLVACAQGLSAVQTNDAAIAVAAQQLAARRSAATAVLERCATDPAELTAAIRDLREATGALMSAAAGGQDTATLRTVENAVLALSKEQLLRDRSLMLPQGWEPNPAAVPAIDALLQ